MPTTSVSAFSLGHAIDMAQRVLLASIMSTCASGFAATLAERPREERCLDTPVQVEGTGSFRCTVSDGVAYFNVPDSTIVGPPEKESPTIQSRNDAPSRVTSTGSGFFVSTQGHVLTNNHVIKGCEAIYIADSSGRFQAEKLGLDAALDLALLKIKHRPESVATFRDGKVVQAGESVTVVGYPLRGLLASGPIVSTGIVNAVAGIRNDPTKFQISAPLQPGNSGAPLIDSSGNVIGVASGKLNATKVASVIGDIPQNVNFAIKGDAAKKFLKANNVIPALGSSTVPIDLVGVSARGRSIATAVECVN